ncbi:hypothetical protein CDAR_122791 [Caerostris darwini]|uniref:Uncharacterized protein n=1 Tax=Caerostris darwini TaxID=1538125 RepID=A0AAV4UZI6_9ARAC|nr:hypothetical protein CDAR_122791 [Caerostris darwini]
MDTQNGWLLNTMPSIKQASNASWRLLSDFTASVLDEMGRGFFADKGLAGHRDKDLQNVSQGLPWLHCCWAFLALKEDFFFFSMEGRKKWQRTVSNDLMLC